MCRRSLALLFLLAACREQPLSASPVAVELSPEGVDFGSVPVGSTADRALSVHSRFAGVVPLTWQVDGGAFVFDGPSSVTVGTRDVPVRFSPGALGHHHGSVIALLDERAIGVVTLDGEGVSPPLCPSSPCHRSTWDASSRRCLDATLPDDTLCAAACAEEAVCVRGECLGRPKACNDGDPCTADSCVMGVGCQHRPIGCPAAGACQVGRCDAALGCVSEAVVDGTRCGPTRGCDLAEVCLAGTCALRPPPDGFECADPTPCQASGRCQNRACVLPAPRALASAMFAGADRPDGGPSPDAWSDLVVDPDGGVVLSSYFGSPPRLHAAGTPLDLFVGERRCIVWQGLLVCADSPVARAVTGSDAVTGATVFSYVDVFADAPQLLASDQDTFLARLASVGPDRLMAMYETRTLINGADVDCRHFTLVLLDGRGHAVGVHSISDPLFDTCNHPHSFGVAADETGNLYVAFTSSGRGSPAVPDGRSGGTLVTSFTPSGLRRWVRWLPLVEGGELAVANGLVLPERSLDALDTRTGAPTAHFAQPFGLGVATRTVLVFQPPTGASTLSATSFAGAPRWSASNTDGFGPLRLARWNGAAVVLTTERPAGGLSQLRARDVESGAVVFSCPVDDLSNPASMEVGPGGVAFADDVSGLGGFGACDRCDPRFAQTRAHFKWVDVAGLLPSDETWPGPWGGPQHAHQAHP